MLRKRVYSRLLDSSFHCVTFGMTELCVTQDGARARPPPMADALSLHLNKSNKIVIPNGVRNLLILSFRPNMKRVIYFLYVYCVGYSTGYLKKTKKNLFFYKVTPTVVFQSSGIEYSNNIFSIRNYSYYSHPFITVIFQ